MQRFKTIVKNTFCTLAVIGMADMMVQAWTSGETKPIRAFLSFFFDGNME
tara:strand:- start:787 stop:936 length:150 start_codon:yes stop_codon:yes gene_type:complete